MDVLFVFVLELWAFSTFHKVPLGLVRTQDQMFLDSPKLKMDSAAQIRASSTHAHTNRFFQKKCPSRNYVIYKQV